MLVRRRGVVGGRFLGQGRHGCARWQCNGLRDRGLLPGLTSGDAALDHHGLLVPGRAQPDDVAVVQTDLPLDLVVVDEEPAWAVRIVDGDPGIVDPDPRVNRADAGNVQAETTGGVGSKENVVDSLFENEAGPSLVPAQDGQRGVARRGGI
jgi:hypothetical protein